MERQILRLFNSLFSIPTNIQSERASERAGRGGKCREGRPGKGDKGKKGGGKEFRTFVCIDNLSFVLDIKRACNHHTLQ